MLCDVGVVNPIEEFKKGKDSFGKRDVDKAYGLFVLAYEHTKSTKTKIECCLEISKCLLTKSIQDKDILEEDELSVMIDETWMWLFKATQYCKNYYQKEEKRSAKSRVRTQKYFRTIKVTLQYLSLLAKDIKKNNELVPNNSL